MTCYDPCARDVELVQHISYIVFSMAFTAIVKAAYKITVNMPDHHIT
jgi:hypothetical protein